MLYSLKSLAGVFRFLFSPLPTLSATRSSSLPSHDLHGTWFLNLGFRRCVIPSCSRCDYFSFFALYLRRGRPRRSAPRPLCSQLALFLADTFLPSLVPIAHDHLSCDERFDRDSPSVFPRPYTRPSFPLDFRRIRTTSGIRPALSNRPFIAPPLHSAKLQTITMPTVPAASGRPRN